MLFLSLLRSLSLSLRHFLYFLFMEFGSDAEAVRGTCDIEYEQKNVYV